MPPRGGEEEKHDSGSQDGGQTLAGSSLAAARDDECPYIPPRERSPSQLSVADRVHVFFGPPVPQQWWVTNDDGKQSATALVTERHPTWFDLLFDLVLVAHFRVAGELLVDKSGSGNNDAADKLIPYVLLSLPVLESWYQVQSTVNHWYSGTFADVVYFAAVTFTSLTTTTNLASCDAKIYTQSAVEHSACKGFGISVAGTRAFSALYWLRCSLHGVRARDGYLWCVRDCIAIVLLLVAGYTNSTAMLWVLAFFDYVGSPIYVRWVRCFSGPIHVDLLIERLGLVIIVALGEVYANLVRQNIGEQWTTKQVLRVVLFVLAGASIAFLVMLLYFYSLDGPGEHATRHAMRVSVSRGLTFIYTHKPLILCITVFSAWLEACVHWKADHGGGDDHHDDGGADDGAHHRFLSSGGDNHNDDDEVEAHLFAYTLGNPGRAANHMALGAFAILYILLAIIRRSCERENILPGPSTHAHVLATKWLPKCMVPTMLDSAIYPLGIGSLILLVELNTNESEDAREVMRYLFFVTLGVTLSVSFLATWQHPHGANYMHANRNPRADLLAVMETRFTADTINDGDTEGTQRRGLRSATSRFSTGRSRGMSDLPGAQYRGGFVIDSGLPDAPTADDIVVHRVSDALRECLTWDTSDLAQFEGGGNRFLPASNVSDALSILAEEDKGDDSSRAKSSRSRSSRRSECGIGMATADSTMHASLLDQDYHARATA